MVIAGNALLVSGPLPDGTRVAATLYLTHQQTHGTETELRIKEPYHSYRRAGRRVEFYFVAIEVSSSSTAS